MRISSSHRDQSFLFLYVATYPPYHLLRAYDVTYVLIERRASITTLPQVIEASSKVDHECKMVAPRPKPGLSLTASTSTLTRPP